MNGLDDGESPVFLGFLLAFGIHPDKSKGLLDFLSYNNTARRWSLEGSVRSNANGALAALSVGAETPTVSEMSIFNMLTSSPVV